MVEDPANGLSDGRTNVERTSDQHAPRRDDRLEREENALLHGAPDEGRSEPRRTEQPGPGETGSGRRPDVDEAYHGAPRIADIEDRAALAATFTPTTFPARRDELVEVAEASYADEGLLRDLRRIPEGFYENVTQLWDELRALRADETRQQRTDEADEP